MDRCSFLKTILSLSAGASLSWQYPYFVGKNDDLGYHTIEKVRFSKVKLNWPRLVGKNARLDVHGRGPTVDIAILKTNQGASGWGSVSRNPAKKPDEIAFLLEGKRLIDLLLPKKGVLNPVFENFEFALYDLAGNILQKPVYQLFGRSKPKIFHCYSGMIYFDDLEPTGNLAGVGKIIEECRFDIDLGYCQLKLKIGRGNRWMEKKEGIKRDIEVTRLVHENFPHCDLLVDANDGYQVEDFITYLEGIKGIPLFWIEEPFAENEASYLKLNDWLKKNRVEVLLADGEYNSNDDQLFGLADKKLIDVFIQDIQGYGFTKWIKLMPALKKKRILASPHNWGSCLKTNYTAHLAGAFGNIATIEGVTSASEDVDLSGYKLLNGKLIPSSKPGFGMELNSRI